MQLVQILGLRLLGSLLSISFLLQAVVLVVLALGAAEVAPENSYIAQVIR
jgi:hypothetical protein